MLSRIDHAPQHQLQTLLGDLQDSLEGLFAEHLGAQERARDALHRRLLLGLELVCKVEEQVVLPALHASTGAAGAMRVQVRQASQELDVLRDLALLSAQTAKDKRDLTLAVMEGLTALHFQRVDSLLADAPAAVDWPALERDVRGLLARWRGEVQAHGEIEDEDRDPVGLPPR